MTWKSKVMISVFFGLIFGLWGEGMAGNTATQTVRFQIQALSEIAVSGNPNILVVEKDRLLKKEVVDRSTTYAITTNSVNQKITGKIDVPMPNGVTLTINLSPPNGTAGTGEVVLSDTATDLVTGIYRKAAANLPITYRLSAAPQADVQNSQRTIILTITH